MTDATQDLFPQSLPRKRDRRDPNAGVIDKFAKKIFSRIWSGLKEFFWQLYKLSVVSVLLAGFGLIAACFLYLATLPHWWYCLAVPATILGICLMAIAYRLIYVKGFKNDG